MTSCWERTDRSRKASGWKQYVTEEPVTHRHNDTVLCKNWTTNFLIFTSTFIENMESMWYLIILVTYWSLPYARVWSASSSCWDVCFSSLLVHSEMYCERYSVVEDMQCFSQHPTVSRKMIWAPAFPEINAFCLGCGTWKSSVVEILTNSTITFPNYCSVSDPCGYISVIYEQSSPRFHTS